eukprot:1013485-Prorocentrum_minimum.AAC.1
MSVLEQHHCAVTVRLMLKEECSLLKRLSPEAQVRARKRARRGWGPAKEQGGGQQGVPKAQVGACKRARRGSAGGQKGVRRGSLRRRSPPPSPHVQNRPPIRVATAY